MFQLEKHPNTPLKSHISRLDLYSSLKATQLIKMPIYDSLFFLHQIKQTRNKPGPAVNPPPPEDSRPISQLLRSEMEVPLNSSAIRQTPTTAQTDWQLDRREETLITHRASPGLPK